MLSRISLFRIFCLKKYKSWERQEHHVIYYIFLNFYYADFKLNDLSEDLHIKKILGLSTILKF